MPKIYAFRIRDIVISSWDIKLSVKVANDHGESIERLEQYIQDGDYFGSLATHLDIVAQTFNKKVDGLGNLGNEYRIYLNRIRDELAYLQEYYMIVPKPREEKNLLG